MKPVIFMFSGQGSQYYQMGKILFKQNKLFQEEMLKADNICQDLIGTSVIEHLYAEHHSISQPFSRTLFTHPAILMTEYALAQVLLAKGITPTAVLGTSLGEFAASVLAGIMTFETAMVAVITQAQMIEDNCQHGGMLAVLGCPITFYYENQVLYQNCELASVNFDSSFTVSGTTKNLRAIEQILAIKDISYQNLAVSHAFHSSLIDPIASNYLNFLGRQTMKAPVLPFISATNYVNPWTNINSKHYWDAIRLPIKFQNTIQWLEEKNNYYYLDIGPSGTLATFVKYILSANPSSTSKPFSILTPFNQNVLDSNLDNLKYILS